MKSKTLAAGAALLALAALPASGPAAADVPPPEPGETVLEGWLYTLDVAPLIHGETPPSGTVVTRRNLGPRWSFARVEAYARTDLDGSVFSSAQGRWCLLRGVLAEDAIQLGSRGTKPRAFDVLDVKDVRAFDGPWRLRPALSGAILRDLFARGVDYARDGAEAPSGGLDEFGRLDGGRRARRVPLVSPPEGSADMYSETAYVDPRTRRYWAVRTGGIAADARWVGPFDLPRPRR